MFFERLYSGKRSLRPSKYKKRFFGFGKISSVMLVLSIVLGVKNCCNSTTIKSVN